MEVLQEYLSGIQKQNTEEWGKQVNSYHVANLQRMIYLYSNGNGNHIFQSAG